MSGDYDIIGAGGFGFIMKVKGTDEVIKFIYNQTGCNEASLEFALQTTVYNALQGTKLCVPKPIRFMTQSPLPGFKCSYSMTLLKPPTGFKHLVHIVNDAFGHNRLIYRNDDMPPSPDNPPRGFFASYSFIVEKLGIPRRRLLKNLGIAFGMLLFIAEIYPNDVEYVFSEGPCLSVLDFGMAVSIEDISFNISDHILGYDIYLPEKPEDIAHFIQGVEKAYHKSDKTPLKARILQQIKTDL